MQNTNNALTYIKQASADDDIEGNVAEDDVNRPQQTQIIEEQKLNFYF